MSNGTGNPSLSTGNATDSICPYGWQLAETTDGNVKKSFSNLTNTYLSFSTTHTSGEYEKIDGKGQYRSDITLLSFLLSGDYYYVSSALVARGSYGNYWSLRGLSGTSANDLNFYSTGINPQDGYGRGYGFAVRCLAR